MDPPICCSSFYICQDPLAGGILTVIKGRGFVFLVPSESCCSFGSFVSLWGFHVRWSGNEDEDEERRVSQFQGEN